MVICGAAELIAYAIILNPPYDSGLQIVIIVELVIACIAQGFPPLRYPIICQNMNIAKYTNHNLKLFIMNIITILDKQH